MKIVSSFHDYYDTALAYGADQTLSYVRQTKEILIPIETLFGRQLLMKGPPSKEPLAYWTNGNGYYSSAKGYYILRSQKGVLGFCGKRYPYFAIEVQEKIGSKFTRTFIYDYDIAIKRYNTLWPPDKYRRRWRKRFKEDRETKALREHFEQGPSEEEWMNLFHEYETPTFLRLNGCDIINPPLKDLGFQVIFNPFEAFQEISMFVGGVLKSVENNTIELDNDIEIVKKGFHLKSSFRQDSPGKKERRRKHKT